jgi:hypothetical protein
MRWPEFFLPGKIGFISVTKAVHAVLQEVLGTEWIFLSLLGCRVAFRILVVCLKTCTQDGPKDQVFWAVLFRGG